MANNSRKKKKSKTTVEVATSKQQQQPVVVGSWEWVAEDRTGNRSKKRKDKEQDQEEEEAVVALVISPTVTSSHGTSSGTPTISATTTTTAIRNFGDPDIDTAIIPLLEHVDRFIDIMNGYNKKKKCDCINSPDHPHLFELLDILTWFAEWKGDHIREIESHPFRFIPSQSYQDLAWTVLGVVGFSTLYLKQDKTRVMDQGRAGSDCCEHHFGNCANNNVSGNLSDFRSFTAKSTNIRTNTFHNRSKTNTSGIKGNFHGPELFAPIQTATTTNRGRNNSYKLET